MENDKKNQNTTRALPHAFKLRVVPLSRYIRLITQTTNKVTRQLWRSLENYETVKKLSMKTIFQSFSVGKCFRTKIQSIYLIYSIENSIFFYQYYETCIPWWQRNVYEWATVWEHFRFFWGTDAPCFLSFMTKNGLTWFGDCERSQQDVCRMKVTASSVLSPAT